MNIENQIASRNEYGRSPAFAEVTGSAGLPGGYRCDQCTVAPAELLVSDLLHWSGLMRVCHRCQGVLSRDGETWTVTTLPNTKITHAEEKP